MKSGSSYINRLDALQHSSFVKTAVFKVMMTNIGKCEIQDIIPGCTGKMYAARNAALNENS